MTAELRLSGRAGGRRLRGRVLVGISAPASLRLEGIAPFGSPIFILAADPQQTTLLLPRDNRVLTGEPPDAVLEALAGIKLGPSDLLALLTACVTQNTRPIAGRDYGRMAAIDLQDGTLWLRKRESTWRVWAGARNGLTVEYDTVAGLYPPRVRIRTDRAGKDSGTDILLGLSQVETNVALGPDAFTVTVPVGAVPLRLDELRDTGPLGEGSGPS